MNIRTDALSGKALDYAVAKAQGWVDFPSDSVEKGDRWHIDPVKAPFGEIVWKDEFSPSRSWLQGGPIMERELIELSFDGAEGLKWWVNGTKTEYDGITLHGKTILVAAMRCFVAHKLGEVIDVPEELL